MNKQIEQDEADLASASVRERDANPAPGGAVRPSHAKAYNFSHAGKISVEELQAITSVNDLFARNITHNLGAWLRTQFDVTLASAEQIMYSEFTERIPETTYLCSVRLEPLDVMGVVQMDLTIAPPIVDLLLGGIGRAGPLREPTDIEDEILISVMEIIVRELNLAWQPVGLKFTLDKREREAQILRLMPASEKTLRMSFDVRMPEVQGSFSLCLPAVVLNTILRRLVAERGRPRRRSLELRERISVLMSEAKFGGVLQFPSMRLNAGELAALVPGTVLRLPLPRNATSELRISGLPMFQAVPVRSGDHRGAQVQGYTPAAKRFGAN